MYDNKLIKRFYKYIKINDLFDCWEWTGAYVEHCGHRSGQFRLDKIHNFDRILAHRLMWELINGDIPDGLVICHKCDNGICLNPSHLFLGTYKDNTHDAMIKGRFNGRPPKLSPSQLNDAIDMRNDGYNWCEISKKYSVSTTYFRWHIKKLDK